MRTSILLAFIVTQLSLGIAAQGPRISTSEELMASLDSAPCKNSDRLPAVRKMFTDLGFEDAAVLTKELEKGSLKNVVVAKKGTSTGTIVIGAHYDKVDEGCGALDNWTGVLTLAHLARTYSNIPTQRSLVFVAFDKEEAGLKGSAAMVKTMSESERSDICAMVNFDSFGQSFPYAPANMSSPRLVKLAENLAKENEFTVPKVSIPEGMSDSNSFLAAKIDAVTLSGLGANWMSILHSSKDKKSAVNADALYMGYRFALAYLSKLDKVPCHIPASTK